jgi:hypothetical protein
LEYWQHHLTASGSGLVETGLRRSVIAPALPKILRRR